MKTLFILFMMIFLISIYSQDTSSTKIDKLEMRTLYNDDDEIIKKGEIVYGNVIQINTETVDFKLQGTNFNSTFKKIEIKQIILSNGQILTFAKEQQTAQDKIAKQYKSNSTVWYVLIGLAVLSAIISAVMIGNATP